MKKKYNVEVGFLTKLIETQDMKTLEELQIRESYLKGDNRRVFSFIRKMYAENGEFPTIRVLETKFPTFHPEKIENEAGEEVIGTEESLVYWGNELRKRSRHNLLAEASETIADLLNDGNTEKAQEVFNSTFFKIEDDIEVQNGVDITKDIESRKRRYLERKETKGMMGIPTGIPKLDYIIKGLVDDTLTTIIAKTGIGKTWLLVIICAYAMLNGYKVLVFVTEMNKELMEDRFDAILFGMMYGGFSYEKFKRGDLDSETEEEYFTFLEEDMTKLESLKIEDASSVSSLIGTVRREKPDLVAVDSAYLMEDDDRADSDWLRVAHITRALKKKVAKGFHIPVLINSQADKSTSKKTGPELENISFTQAIGQDSDNILTMYRDEVMIQDHEMGIKVVKNREGNLGKVMMTWDFLNMQFNGIYAEVEGEDSENDEENSLEDGNLVIDVE